MWEGPTIAGNAIPWQVCQGWVKNGSRASYQQTVFLHGPRSSACFQRPVLSFRPDFPQRWTVTRKRKAEIKPFPPPVAMDRCVCRSNTQQNRTCRERTPINTYWWATELLTISKRHPKCWHLEGSSHNSRMFFNDKQITGTLTRCHDLGKSRVGSSQGGFGDVFHLPKVFFL